MELLEQIKKITGVDSALGLRFSRGNLYAPMLPDGGKLIGYTDSVFFCFVEGYQDTVFAVIPRQGYGTLVYPLAYDFREFLRLVLTCGSASAVARAVTCARDQFSGVIASDSGKKGLEFLRNRFDLPPVADPYGYVQTVRQVIDCSPIRC